MAVKRRGLLAAFIVVFMTTIFVTGTLFSHNVSADTHPLPCKDGETQTTDANNQPVCNTATNAGATAASADDNASTNTTTCAVEKIGWLVCPLLEQAAKISDKTFGMLADNFLRTDPQLISDKSGTKVAWDIARNIANIMFIITFLIIIVSQVTSMGINNYGIKKMLPRLIIAAIAVNVSYYICQLVVDVTNILGYEIQNMLTDVANGIGPSVFGNASQYGVTQASNGGWGNFLEYATVIALAAAGIVWLVMGPMVAVITMVIITAITIVVILLLRKAIIVLLIVISPIAIVLYLLPNTEKLFSKWMRMFTQILMVFPVIGLLFGAGQLASTIVLVAGSQSSADADAAIHCNPDDKKIKDDFKAKHTSDYAQCGIPSISLQGQKDGEDGDCSGAGSNTAAGSGCKRTVGIMTGLVAMGIAVAPLIAVWSVLKGALSAAGAIGGKITSTIGKGGGGFTKRAEASDTARQNRMALRSMQGRPGIGAGAYRRRARKDAVRSSVDKELGREKQDYISKEALKDESLQKKMAGSSLLRGAEPDAQDRVRVGAQSAQKGLQLEGIKAAHLEVDKLDESGLMAVLEDPNVDLNSDKALAAIERLVTVGGGDSMAKVSAIAASGGVATAASQTFANALASDNPGYFTSRQINDFSNGQGGGVAGFEAKALESIQAGIYSESAMASASPSHLAFAKELATKSAAAGDSAALNTLVRTATQLQNNATLKGTIGRSRSVVNDLHPPSP